MINRRNVLLLGVAAAALALLPMPAFAASMRATLYKDPNCDCCEGYGAYLKTQGFEVTIVPTDDLPAMARRAGVPEQLDGCHITKIDSYIVIGHVPIDAVRKLLAERPALIGISIPGMPSGLPGMEGSRDEPIAIYEIDPAASPPRVFMMVS
jgi:hypothetical protein